MHDWRKSYLTHIRTIGTGTRIEIVGGKSYLVVNHNMNGSSGTIALQSCHLHDFIGQSLPRNGSISMNQDGQYFGRVSVKLFFEFGTSDSLHHCAYRFQMRRIGCNIHIDLLPSIRGSFGSPSQMVFYISVKNDLFIVLAIKLAKDVFG